MEASWTQIGMFWATASLAVITVTAVIINYFLLRSQIDPHVIVYAKHDESRPTIILLIIENVGKGMAHNVRFELSRPIPLRAFGIDPKTAEEPVPMTEGPFVNGIPSLGPGSSRVFAWGQYGGLVKALGDEPVGVKTVFLSRRLPPLESTPLVTESVLEIDSFAGTDAVDPDGARQSAKELKRIADTLAKLERRV